MRIALDFDGVIADCGKLKTAGAKEFFGVDILPEKFKKELVVSEGLLSLEQYREIQKKIYESRELGLVMEAVVDAVKYINRLITDGHKLEVVTSRGGVALEIAKEWSQKQNLQIDFVGVGYGNSKVGALQNAEVYVDDDLDKLESLVNIVPNLFLFSQGYNLHVNSGGIAQRVFSWEELFNAIQCIAGG